VNPAVQHLEQNCSKRRFDSEPRTPDGRPWTCWADGGHPRRARREDRVSACGNRSWSDPALATSGPSVRRAGPSPRAVDQRLAGAGGARRVLYWMAGVGRLCYRRPRFAEGPNPR